MKKAALLLLAAAMLLLCSTSLCAATNYDLVLHGNYSSDCLYDLILLNDSTAVAVGVTSLPDNRRDDMLLLWVNSSHGVIRALSWGAFSSISTKGIEYAWSVAKHPSGDIIVGGESRYGYYYSVILRLKPNGDIVYAKRWLVNSSTSGVSDVVALPDGDIVVFGGVCISGSHRTYIARFNGDLSDMKWGVILQKGKSDCFSAAAVDVDEDCIYLAFSSNGTTYAAYDFGTFVKMNLTDGSIIWCKTLDRINDWACHTILYRAVVPVDDGFIAIGDNQNSLNITAVRINSDGSLGWIKEYSIVEDGVPYYTVSYDAVLHNSLCYILGGTEVSVEGAFRPVPFIFYIDPSSGACSPLAQGFFIRYVTSTMSFYPWGGLELSSSGKYWFCGCATPGSLRNCTLDIECTRHPWHDQLVMVDCQWVKISNASINPEDADHSLYKLSELPLESIDISSTDTCIVYPSTSITFWYSFPKGWNLVSLPVSPHPTGNIALEDLLEGFEGSYIAFTWNSSMRRYVDVDELEPGKGYWLYLSGSFIARVKGTPVYNLTLDLPAGWSMVGSIYGKDATASGTNLYPSFFIWSTEKNDYVERSSLPEGYGAWMLAYKPTTVQLT